MYEIMPDSGPDLLAIRVTGKLDKSDYERLHPWLHERLAEHSCPSVLVVMDEFKGWESSGALIEDAKLDLAHHDDVRRVAMVGDRAWEKWMTLLTAPFIKAEMRYFDLDDLDAAREWARSGNAGQTNG
jgi:hypothetical protein